MPVAGVYGARKTAEKKRNNRNPCRRRVFGGLEHDLDDGQRLPEALG